MREADVTEAAMERRATTGEAGQRAIGRRQLVLGAAAGTIVAAIGGVYVFRGERATEEARALQLPDGRPRLPPGQRVIEKLRDMGGSPGDPSLSAYRLRVHGEVEEPLELDYAALLRLPQTEQSSDVHSVTRWAVLDGRWTGVQVRHLAELAKVRPEAKHVIFEAANGYTTNVPIEEALRPNVLVAHHLGGDPLAFPNGAPVRGLVPDLYFWKSAKWLSGIRFARFDEPGFWEVRGYHNHADPWKEERFS